ncbi:MAG: vanadium-dependent haloperoxidase [Granulosicoccus sp.]
MELKKRPFQENMDRSELANKRRTFATSYAGGYAALPTRQNGDEDELKDESFVANFTKGLRHDEFGQLENSEDYVKLVNQINQQDAESFESIKRGIDSTSPAESVRQGGAANGSDIQWRGWESPRAGHYFDLQGPDADSVSMPPAPELGSEELTAEIAEVYALALLRDIPFSQISDGSGNDAETGITTNEVLNAVSALSWFNENTADGLTLQQRRRRAARRVDHGEDFSIANPPDAESFDSGKAFRGSGPAVKAGPYISQYLLLGNNRSPATGNITDSSIAYGRQVIDQKIETFPPHKDFMLHWKAYLDVQNGADFGADNESEIVHTRRFITTPRDLATYVRYDALYQAYLNACLFMLGSPEQFGFQEPVEHPYTKRSGPGFPDGPGDHSAASPPSRQAFAAFGGPHILSLVTEVATRCLKAVRRQKFNYHRRARPERLGALLTLQGTQGNADSVSDQLGNITSGHLATMLNAANLGPLLSLVDQHNTSRKTNGNADRHLDFSSNTDPDWFANTSNYLLPMAFAEGSPMHPSYGAGHATVAGGCITMLKAFFNTTDKTGKSIPWPSSLPTVQATIDGSELEQAPDSSGMTISGELNKLAANISIARNMAGVHYYTDYYESLRMGERIATGILIEQMKQYNEPVEFSFETFDGDLMHILKIDYDYAEPRVFVFDSDGVEVGLDSWWHRHQNSPEVASVTPLFARNTAAEKDQQAASAELG